MAKSNAPAPAAAPAESHGSLISNPSQLAWAVLFAFLVPIAIIVGLTQYVTGGLEVDAAKDGITDAAVQKRIEPVGRIVLGEAPQPVQPAAPVAAKAEGPADGATVYAGGCSACHAAGVAGAPKAGDKGAWAPRIAQGKATLYEHAIKGIRGMPAKGGNAALSDDEVKAAVDHLVGLAK
jgi:cytochrome c5